MSLSYYLAKKNKSVAIFELVNKVEALTAELAAYKRDAEWQPIESAPKTSRAIMVHCAEYKNTYIVTWGDVGNLTWWRIFGYGGALTETPTHWKPLPAPPIAAAIAAQEPK
jgi:hypothetical protein